MPHTRTLIREAVSALLTGLPTTGARVEVGRTRPLPANHEPTLLLYTVEETSGAPYDGNPGRLGRTVQLFIDGRVVKDKPPDDDLDQIAFEVEERMRADPTFRGLVFDSMLATTFADVKADGETHIGAIRLEYRVRYAEPAEEDD